MNLLILTEADHQGGSQYRIQEERVVHIRNILGKGLGDELAVGLLNGGIGEARIVEDTGSTMEVDCGELKEPPEVRPIVDIICALPRPMTLRKILFTSGMMGVRNLHLIRANRVERSFFQSPLLQPEKYNSLLIDGLSQGRRTRLPQVTIHDRFKPFVQETLIDLIKAGPLPTITGLCLAQSSDGMGSVFAKDAARFVFAVGPEGGWVPFEVDLWEEAGFRAFCLGDWTLRVEHAVTSALAQLALLAR